MAKKIENISLIAVQIHPWDTRLNLTYFICFLFFLFFNARTTQAPGEFAVTYFFVPHPEADTFSPAE